MGLRNLFLLPWEQVFVFPRQKLGQRWLSLGLIVTFLISPFSERSLFSGERLRSSSSVEFMTSSLVSPLIDFAQSRCSSTSLVFHQLSAWCLGDQAFRALRKKYRRPVFHCALLMITDAVVSLGVPFVGQALYETAARGDRMPGSLSGMVFISALLLFVEGLDLVRRFLAYRMKNIASHFVADVRLLLLNWNAALASNRRLSPHLIYLHAPLFVTRNIDVPLKWPILMAQALLNGYILWQMNSLVTLLAVSTAMFLGCWSKAYGARLAETTADVKKAESETLSFLENENGPSKPFGLVQVRRYLYHVRRLEIKQARVHLWYEGVVDRVSTITLMTVVMLIGAWHEYWTGAPDSAHIMTLLALAWNVQSRISALLTLTKQRLEADGSSFILSDLQFQSSHHECSAGSMRSTRGAA